MTFRFNFLAVLLVLSATTLPVTICAAQATTGPVVIVSHVDFIPDAYKPLAEENATRLLRQQAAAEA